MRAAISREVLRDHIIRATPRKGDADRVSLLSIAVAFAGLGLAILQLF